MAHPPLTSWLDPEREVQQVTRRQTRPVTAELIDDLRRALLSQEPPHREFRRPLPSEQQPMINFAMRVLQIPHAELTATPDQQCDEAIIRVITVVLGAYANSPSSQQNTFRTFQQYYCQADLNTFGTGEFSVAYALFRFVINDSRWRWGFVDAEAAIDPETIVNAFNVYAILSEISGPGVQPPLHRQATTAWQAIGVMSDQFEGKVQSIQSLVQQAIGEVDSAMTWVHKLACAAESVQAGLGQVHQRSVVVDDGTQDLQSGRECLDHIKEKIKTILNSL